MISKMHGDSWKLVGTCAEGKHVPGGSSAVVPRSVCDDSIGASLPSKDSSKKSQHLAVPSGAMRSRRSSSACTPHGPLPCVYESDEEEDEEEDESDMPPRDYNYRRPRASRVRRALSHLRRVAATQALHRLELGLYHEASGSILVVAPRMARAGGSTGVFLVV